MCFKKQDALKGNITLLPESVVEVKAPETGICFGSELRIAKTAYDRYSPYKIYLGIDNVADEL